MGAAWRFKTFISATFIKGFGKPICRPPQPPVLTRIIKEFYRGLQIRCAAFTNLNFHNVCKGFWNASLEPFTTLRFDKDYKGISQGCADQVCRFQNLHFRNVYKGFWNASLDPFTALRFDKDYKGILQGFAFFECYKGFLDFTFLNGSRKVA